MRFLMPLILFMALLPRLAAAQTATTTTIQAAFQIFEYGYMVWEGDTGDIHVLYANGNRAYYWEDLYAAWPDNPISENPPMGRVKPVNGFGRVWGNLPEVRQQLGWATTSEHAYTVVMTRYEHPRTAGPVTDAEFVFPDGQLVKLYNNGTWQFVSVSGTPTSIAATSQLPTPKPDSQCICSLPQTFTMRAAIQPFEHGYMLYWSETGSIWVLSNDGKARLFNSKDYGSIANDPVKDTPPTGFFRPILGFGKVWGYFAEVRQILGWATAEEQTYTMRFERILSGNRINFVVTAPDHQHIVITDRDTWYFVPQ